MTDKELLYVKTVAEERNVTRAAEKLHIAQPSLTQCLRRIETRLEFELFERGKKGVELTEAGRVVFDAACEMLKTWDAALDRLKELRGREAGSLTVGASWYGTTLVLTRAVTAFNRRWPDVTVRLVEKNTADLLTLLRNGEIDAALTHEYPQGHPLKTTERGLTQRELFTERFCVLAHERFGLDRRARRDQFGEPEIDLAKLSDVPLIAFSAGQRIRRVADFAFSQAGVQPKVALTTYGFPSAVELVAQGAGAALLPELYARRVLASEQYKMIRRFRVPGQYAAEWTTAVCCRRSQKLPDPVKNLISILKRIDPYA